MIYISMTPQQPMLQYLWRRIRGGQCRVDLTLDLPFYGFHPRPLPVASITLVVVLMVQ